MKVFDYTDGRKGKLLANINRANSSGGWLVRKGDNIYRVELTNAPRLWSWACSATRPIFNEEGKFAGEEEITPEEFGVEAICFCTGEITSPKDMAGWHWTVLGTDAWNRKSCKAGILKATFTHTMTIEDRSLMCAKDCNMLHDPDVADMVAKFEADPELVAKYIEEGVHHES